MRHQAAETIKCANAVLNQLDEKNWNQDGLGTLWNRMWHENKGQPFDSLKAYMDHSQIDHPSCAYETLCRLTFQLLSCVPDYETKNKKLDEIYKSQYKKWNCSNWSCKNTGCHPLDYDPKRELVEKVSPEEMRRDLQPGDWVYM